MTVKEFQQTTKDKMGILYPVVDIKTEWRAEMGSSIYSPRVDVAVGPFAIHNSLANEYDDLIDRSRDFIEALISQHNQNIRTINSELSLINFDSLKFFNENSRCFICIEVENKISRKHLIGGAVNASVLGRVGVIVAWNDKIFKASLKLINYFNFLNQVKKNSFNTGNLLILNKDQFYNLLQEYVQRV